MERTDLPNFVLVNSEGKVITEDPGARKARIQLIKLKREFRKLVKRMEYLENSKDHSFK